MNIFVHKGARMSSTVRHRISARARNVSTVSVSADEPGNRPTIESQRPECITTPGLVISAATYTAAPQLRGEAHAEGIPRSLTVTVALHRPLRMEWKVEPRLRRRRRREAIAVAWLFSLCLMSIEYRGIPKKFV